MVAHKPRRRLRLTVLALSVGSTFVWRAAGLFLLLTVCLDAPFWVLVNATHTVNAPYVFGMMSMPAITAVVYADADLPSWFWLLTFTFVAAVVAVVFWAKRGQLAMA